MPQFNEAERAKLDAWLETQRTRLDAWKMIERMTDLIEERGW